jgi:putative membrane protein
MSFGYAFGFIGYDDHDVNIEKAFCNSPEVTEDVSMPKFLVTWLLTAIALLITAFFVPGIQVNGFGGAIVTAAILGFVNAIVRPILLILTLPLTIFTLGLFLPLLNVICFLLVGRLSPDFEVSNFFSAILGAIVLAIVSGLLTGLAEEEG